MKHECSKIRTSHIAHRTSHIAAIKPKPCRRKTDFSAAFLRPFLPLLLPTLLLNCDPIGELAVDEAKKRVFPEWLRGEWYETDENGEQKRKGTFTKTKYLPKDGPELDLNDTKSGVSFTLSDDKVVISQPEQHETTYRKGPDGGVEFSTENAGGLFLENSRNEEGPQSVYPHKSQEGPQVKNEEGPQVKEDTGKKTKIVKFSGMGRVHPTTKEQSPIKGSLSVNEDVTRIIDLSITEQNETPGIGSRITEEGFLEQFRGEKIGAEILMNPSSGDTYSSDRDDSAFDAVSGATLTSTAVAKIINDAIQKLRGGDYSEGKVFPEWIQGEWYETDGNGHITGARKAEFTETQYTEDGAEVDLNDLESGWSWDLSDSVVLISRPGSPTIKYVKASDDKFPFMGFPYAKYSRNNSSAKRRIKKRVFPEWLRGEWYEVDKNNEPTGLVQTVFTETEYRPFGGKGASGGELSGFSGGKVQASAQGEQWDLNKPLQDRLFWLFFEVSHEGGFRASNRNTGASYESDINYKRISDEQVSFFYTDETYSRTRAKSRPSEKKIFPEWIRGTWTKQKGKWHKSVDFDSITFTETTYTFPFPYPPKGTHTIDLNETKDMGDGNLAKVDGFQVSDNELEYKHHQNGGVMRYKVRKNTDGSMEMAAAGEGQPFSPWAKLKKFTKSSFSKTSLFGFGW